jgi:hypothetical protein
MSVYVGSARKCIKYSNRLPLLGGPAEAPVIMRVIEEFHEIAHASDCGQDQQQQVPQQVPQQGQGMFFLTQ